jgi:hypothetical protein
MEKPQRLTVAQYLEAEPLSDVRHEYLGGDVYARAAPAPGTTSSH